MRAVIDTSVIVGALLRPEQSPGTVLRLLRQGASTYVHSSELIEELAAVLRRPRLRERHRLGDADVDALLGVLALRGHAAEPRRKIKACRDPEDDKVLEAALAGGASAIVTADNDLLVLGEFEGIPILTPDAFLRLLTSP